MRRSAARPRSWASARAWNVPAVSERVDAQRLEPVDQLARRRAAVNVTASTCLASAWPSRTRYAMRRVSTRVLPEPAGARIASGVCGSTTAARWCGSRPARSASMPVECVTRRTVPGGCDRIRASWREHGRRRARDAGRPRVVFAASQLRSPRGPSLGHLLPARRPRGRRTELRRLVHRRPRRTAGDRSLVRPFRPAGWRIRSRRNGEPAAATVRPRRRGGQGENRPRALRRRGCSSENSRCARSVPIRVHDNGEPTPNRGIPVAPSR